MRRAVFPLFASLVLASPAAAQTLPPRDECAADPDFARFRARFLDIVARHDGPALLAIATDDIRFSFGDSPGDHGFAQEWGLATPENSGLWLRLANALVLGCAREGDEMISPYLFARMPGALDPYFAGVAGPEARLYPARSTEGEGVPIAWAVLAEVTAEDGGWSRVRLADGRTGFVDSGEVLQQLDYRVIFARRDGRWRMTAFIAGD